jgi:hypothetical protein
MAVSPRTVGRILPFWPAGTKGHGRQVSGRGRQPPLSSGPFAAAFMAWTVTDKTNRSANATRTESPLTALRGPKVPLPFLRNPIRRPRRAPRGPDGRRTPIAYGECRSSGYRSQGRRSRPETHYTSQRSSQGTVPDDLVPGANKAAVDRLDATTHAVSGETQRGPRVTANTSGVTA